MGIGDGFKGLGNRARGISDDVRLRAMLAGDKIRANPISRGAKTVAVGGAGLMGGLAIGTFNRGKKLASANGIVLLSFVLFLFDRAVGYHGFYITGINSFVELSKLFASLVYVAGVWGFFYYFMSRDRSLKAISSSIFAMIVVVISLTLAAKFDTFSVFHIGFILLLWFKFIRQREDAPRANILLVVLLVFDLYLYSIVMAVAPQFVQWASGFPILFFLTLGFVWEQTNSKLAWTMIFLTVLWYFITAGPALAEKLNTAGIEGISTRLNPKEVMVNFKKRNIDEPIKKLKDGIGAWLSSQISYAISGKVEQNQREPLGVYLEDVQSADPRYYEDEEVIIWGTVKARTLDDPINIKVGCFVDNDLGKTPSKEVDPKDKFSVFTMEEKDFACKFTKEQIEAKTLKTGANTVTTFADFNFETLAELKVYFMNQERIRAMSRENQDPLDEFDVRDRKPAAIYTNGPAELLMGTTSPLIGVSDSYIAYPTVDFSLKNRDGWEGRINSLKEMVLFVPEGIDINASGGCNKEFKEYGPTECKKSCEKFVYDDCTEVCAKGNCGYDCNEVKTRCENVCGALFDENGQKYSAYELNMDNVKVKNEMKDFDKFKLFRCRFTPDPSRVLGTSPITTKFFRIKARYNYTVESPVTIIIDKIPDELKEGTDTTTPTPTPTPTP